MTQTYHVGLLKQGKRLVIQVADSVDQLSCELWKYLGERETTIKRLQDGKVIILASVNASHDTAFTSVSIRRVPSADFSAGHVDTIGEELREYYVGPHTSRHESRRNHFQL